LGGVSTEFRLSQEGIMMGTKIRKIASGTFLRLAYSAPSSQERSATKFRPYTLPATKALPFVKVRANDQPLWHPESFWHVQSTGKRERDIQMGRKYARLAIAAMKSDGNDALLAFIMQDIIEDAVERVAKTGRRQHTATVLGFLREISQSIAAKV
jgi:hypothetical protein